MLPSATVALRAPVRKGICTPIAATLEPFGGHVVAVSDEARTLEGAVPPGRTVIIEFPDVDHAQNWHTSDAYAPLPALRKTLATTSLVVVPGGLTSRD